jgi:branched-subunit amino acid transport protein
MAPATALVAISAASMVRGGARTALPPPSPEKGFSLEGLYDAFMKINEPLRFFISGTCGNVVFFYIERLAFFLLKKNENLPTVMKDYLDSVSFFIAYILQVIPQHWFHALLVYGLHSIDTRKKYFTTLFGCYSA